MTGAAASSTVAVTILAAYRRSIWKEGVVPGRRPTHRLEVPALVYVALAIAAAASILTADTFLSLPLTLGSDWEWYADGPARIAAGLPLYDPAMLAGPFDYLAMGPVWNMAPWALPFVLVPWGQTVWWALMAVTLVLAMALAWPRLPPVGAVLLAVTIAVSAPFLMGMTWGNLQSIAALGVVLWFIGRERGWWWLEALGIALAFVKVIPAIPLVLWSLDRPRVLLGSAVMVAVLALPAVLYSGLGVIGDFVVMWSNVLTVDTKWNLSPMVTTPTLLVRAMAIVLILVGVRRSPTVAFVGVCLLVSNLYSDWFLLPMVAALVEFGRPARIEPRLVGPVGAGPIQV